MDYPADPGCSGPADTSEDSENAEREPQYAATWFVVPPPSDTQRLLFTPAAAASSHYRIGDITTQIMSMPAGHRALIFHDLSASQPEYGYTNMREDPRDFSTDPVTGNRYVTLWWDQGANSLAARIRSWLIDFRNRGGVLDEVIFDYEEYYPYSYGLQICGVDSYYYFVSCGDISSRYRAIESDPRFYTDILPDLEARGFQLTGSLEYTLTHRYPSNTLGDPFLIWDSVMMDRYAQAIQRAFFEPVNETFPGAKISNYGYATEGQQFRIPDAFGNNNYLYTSGQHMGTHQAPVLYGFLSQWFHPPSDTPLDYPVTAFNAARSDLNRLRAGILSDPRPSSPWIPPREWDDIYRGSPMYQELVLHALLTGIDHFTYWNPYGQFDSDRLLDRTLLEFEHIGGLRGRHTLETSTLPWESHIMVTCMQTLNRRLCRATPDPSLGDPRSLTQVTASSVVLQAGTSRATFPHGVLVSIPTSDATGGLWIAMPDGELPLLSEAR